LAALDNGDACILQFSFDDGANWEIANGAIYKKDGNSTSLNTTRDSWTACQTPGKITGAEMSSSEWTSYLYPLPLNADRNMSQFRVRFGCDSTDITKGFAMQLLSTKYTREEGMRLYVDASSHASHMHNDSAVYDMLITGQDGSAGNSGAVHEFMRFDATTKRIGVNDSTPSYTFDVDGDINATGEVKNSGSNLTSDERLKENIQDMDPMLTKIMQIRPVAFDWKEGARGGRLDRPEYRSNDYGFIAQELSEILPNMVSVGDDPLELQGVSYSKMVSVLTKAIQELTEKVAQLEAKVTDSE